MKRLNININAATVSDLRRIKRDRGLTYTEIIRRAVSVYALLWRAQASGLEVRLVDEVGDCSVEVTLR